MIQAIIVKTSGFWPRLRARALRAPVFLRAPPAHRSFAALYSSAKKSPGKDW